MTTETWTPEGYWDDRYGSGQVWSGSANVSLVRVAGDLPPGTALELGCGEGGDALWLAEHGWQVLAVDVSQVALDRAARRAQEAGVADRVTWQRHDLDRTFPGGTFDLVTAHYLHTPLAFAYDALVRRAADAVAPGGTLLVVGHSPDHVFREGHDHPHVEMPTVDDVLAAARVPEGGWEVLEAGPFEREVVDVAAGTRSARTDLAVRLRRVPTDG
jgi:SAM-dependent methyltransferase